jgi:O-antigen/teichoic acid export membrane protein
MGSPSDPDDLEERTGPRPRVPDLVAWVIARSPLGGRLTRGVAWSLAGALGIQTTTLLAAILTARILGQTGFGELALVRSTVLTLGALAGSGLGLAATKHVAELRDLDPARAGRMVGLLSNAALVLGAIAALACWVFARPLAAWLSAEPGLAPALRAGALLLLVHAFGGVLTGALSGLEAFRAAARLLLLEGVLGLLLVPSGAWVAGVSGAVMGTVAAALVALPFKHGALRRRLAARRIVVVRRHAVGEWLGLGRFTVPAVLLGFSVQPFEWWVRVSLAHSPGGLAELGLFAAAFSWGTAVLFLPAQITGPALPILTHTLAAGNRTGLLRLLRSIALVTSGLSVAVAVPLMLLARPIMAAYGPGFAAGSTVLTLVLVAYCVAPFSGLFRSILASTGRMWWQLGHSVIWGVGLLVAFGGLGAQGALGLAWSYLVAYAVVVVLQGVSVRVALGRIPVVGEDRPQ